MCRCRMALAETRWSCRNERFERNDRHGVLELLPQRGLGILAYTFCSSTMTKSWMSNLSSKCSFVAEVNALWVSAINDLWVSAI